MQLCIWVLLNFFIAILSVSGVAIAAADELIKVDPACTCDPKIIDPFEVPMRFNFGVHKDQCIDACLFRGAGELATAEKMKYKPQADEILVTNVRHQGRFWIAKIPKRKVASVSMGFEDFRPKVAHVFMRFNLEDGAEIELFSQTPGADGKYVQDKVKELVLSVEGVPPRGGLYSLMEGLQERFLIVYKLQTLEDTTRIMVYEKKHNVRQFRLRLSPERQNQLMEEAIQASLQKSFRSKYNLLTHNCSTSLFSLLESRSPSQMAKDSLWKALDRLEAALPINFPFSTLTALRKRGFIGPDDSSRVVNLEEERPFHAPQFVF